MRKILCLFFMLVTFVSGTISVYAGETINQMSVDDCVNVNLSSETIEKIGDIPIYFTYIENAGETELIKEAAIKEIDDKRENGAKNLGVDYFLISNDDYKVVEIEEASRDEIISNPIYRGTFLRIEELVNQGVTVNYVNLFMKEVDVTPLSNNLDDPTYWENNYEPLGNYNNYKFLYVESASNVESSWVTPGNISSTLKWNEIVNKTLEAVLDHYVKGDFYKAVRAVSSSLSTFFDSVDTPLSVTYSTAGGYLKAKVSGTLYVRTILIEDKLDRVSGYAYYDWGQTEEFSANLKIDAKWPTSNRTSGTYEYGTGTYTFPAQSSRTPGFYGGSALCGSVIDLYENTVGYFTHNEKIEINSIIANLLN